VKVLLIFSGAALIYVVLPFFIEFFLPLVDGEQAVA
jgi:hypothetical protein